MVGATREESRVEIHSGECCGVSGGSFDCDLVEIGRETRVGALIEVADVCSRRRRKKIVTI